MNARHSWLCALLAVATTVAACDQRVAGADRAPRLGNARSAVNPTLSPANVTLSQGQTQQFTATGTGPYTWALQVSPSGSISSAGLYTAGSPGSSGATDTVTVTDTGAGNSTGTATVTISKGVNAFSNGGGSNGVVAGNGFPILSNTRATKKAAQTFQAAAPVGGATQAMVTLVAVDMIRVSGGSGQNIKAEIHSLTGSGGIDDQGTSNAFATGTVDAQTALPTLNLKTRVLIPMTPGTALTVGTNYAVIIKPDVAGTLNAFVSATPANDPNGGVAWWYAKRYLPGGWVGRGILSTGPADYTKDTTHNLSGNVFMGEVYPAPTTSSISPSSATAGGAGFTLTVTGTNFFGASTVKWGGSARTTTYVSATQLTAAINGADIASSGTTSVTVTTPAPGGGTSGGQTFTVSNSASKYGFPFPTGSVRATICSGAMLVQLQDAGGNAITNSTGGSLIVALSRTLQGGGSPTGTTTYYSDSACASQISAPLTGFTIAAGTSTNTFYFKHSAQENLTITAADGSGQGYTSATANVVVMLSSILAGKTNMKFWLKADSIGLGNNAAVPTWSDSSGNGYTWTSSGSPTYTTADSALNNQPTVKFVGSSAQFFTSAYTNNYITGTNPWTLTVVEIQDASGCCSNFLSWYQTGGPGDENIQVAKSGALMNLWAGSELFGVSDGTALGTAYVTVWRRISSNSWDVRVNGVQKGTSSSTVSLGTPTNNLHNAQFTIGADADTSVQRFTGRISEMVLHSTNLSNSDLSNVECELGDKYGVSVSGGCTSGSTASILAYSASVSLVGKTLCSGVMTVQLQNIYGDSIANSTGSAVTVALSTKLQTGASTTGTTTYYSDSTCTTQISSPSTGFTIANGSKSANFYFKHSAVENIVVAAVDGSGHGYAPTNANVTVANNKYAFTVAATTLSTTACTGAMTVQLQDPNSSALTNSTGGALVVALSRTLQGGGSPAGTTTYYSDVGCVTQISSPSTGFSIANGSNSNTFYMKHSAVENITVTAADGSGNGYTSATTNVTVSNSYLTLKTNMKFWLKADSIGLGNNAAVSTWSDSSGNGYTWTSSGSPTYKTSDSALNNQPTVKFVGSSAQFFTSAYTNNYITGTNPWTLTVVEIQDDTAIANFLSWYQTGGPSDENIQVAKSGSNVNLWAGSDILAHADGTTVGTAHIVVWRRISSNSWDTRVDGVQKSTSSSSISLGTPTNNLHNAQFTIGADADTSVQRFTGRISEMVLHSAGLSNSDLSNVECELGSKYGITVTGC